MNPLPLHLEQLVAVSTKDTLHSCSFPLLVVPTGSAPVLHAYRARLLLLEEGTVNGASSADRTPDLLHVEQTLIPLS